MIRVLVLTIFLAVVQCFPGFAQKNKKNTPAPVSPAAEVDEAVLQKYSYPFYTILNGATTPLSGCFIKYKDSSYFVTSRHHFFTPVNEARKLSNVMIFVEANNQRNNAKALSLNMKKQRLIPLCYDSICTDIVLLPMLIPSDYEINYVELATAADIQNSEMAIAGYVQDTANIILTKFHSYLKRDSTYFLTELSNMKDQSGSPVLAYTVGNKGQTKVSLAGIYSGRELSQENFNKGLVSRASLIHKLFEVKKTKTSEPARTVKPVRKKKKQS